jgi:predicted ATPase
MLRDLALSGEHAILFGPAGIGKTALLRAVEAAVVEQGVRVGFSEGVRSLADVTSTLGRAYPDVEIRAVSARVGRSRLRNAAEASASVLLLDDVRSAGTMLKGLLRSFRGTGTGVLLAVDVNDGRDHSRMRGWRLARREIAIPRLHANSIRAIIHSALGSGARHPIVADDLRAIVQASEGLPGRALSLVARLAAPSSWRDGRIRVGSLRAAAVIDELERYRAGLEIVGTEP